MLEQHFIHIKNSKSEAEMLNSVKYCMAVDSWHHSVARQINPKLKVFNIHYNLRDSFYSSRKWDIEKINRYTITTNPGGTALKGLHKLFEAVALLKNEYPDILVKVPGMKSNENGIVVTSGYAKYLKHLIKKLGIEKNVKFLGAQTTEQMIENMLSAHINIIPSCIEGPSLVLHEGMHLGLPTIATFRGGMADFVDDKVNGFLYDFNEEQYLALRIKEIFDNDDLAVSLSRKAIEKSEREHDRNINLNAYLSMYRAIMEES